MADISLAWTSAVAEFARTDLHADIGLWPRSSNGLMSRSSQETITSVGSRRERPDLAGEENNHHAYRSVGGASRSRRASPGLLMALGMAEYRSGHLAKEAKAMIPLEATPAAPARTDIK